MSMAVHSLTLLPVSSFRGAVQSKPRLLKSRSLPSNPPPIFSLPNYHRQRKTLSIFASVSVSNPELRTGPDDLVASILSKVCPFPLATYYLYFLLFSYVSPLTQLEEIRISKWALCSTFLLVQLWPEWNQ